ncbi:DUF2306 domain-containing protein [Bacillus weihaiensis]|uniref:DUF2306 domain-containing protein n=1 Tax=Bacillus weihaiensis TaxID=1547283 RepID=UPI002354B735|nr:DUF2306 domain-containing protein [Bacillus weihaiensis]
MLESVFHVLRILHIIGGFVALFVFWIPIITKKGGKLHYLFGWIYVYGMILVAISAFYMGVYRIFFDSNTTNEQVSFSWFLLFISILSSASAYYGLRVLRFKTRKQVHTHMLDLFFSLLLLLSGIGISIYGFTQSFVLLSWFPLVGIALGLTQLIYWLKIPTKKMHWWFEHFSGMLACCISTITAFTVFGAPRLLNVESVNIILWFLPTIIITPLIIGLGIYYTKKFNKPKGINL